MTEVEHVATWIGLIAGVAGIILSVVALWFTFVVNDRASQINDNTIRSLQSIEKTVERLSEDARELVKGAWDKMLGSVAQPVAVNPSSEKAEQIASGLAAEIKDNISTAIEESDRKTITKQEFEDRLESALASQRSLIENLIRGVAELGQSEAPAPAPRQPLSSRALVLAKLLRPRHLTADQFKMGLKDSELGDALAELRERGYLVPLLGREGDQEQRVYYFPSRDVRSFVLARAPRGTSFEQKFAEALLKIGYPLDGKSNPD